MQCEICGQQAGKGTRIKMDGVEMLVCSACERFGEAIVQPQQSMLAKKIFPSFEKPIAFEQLLLADDFAQRIKKAREQKQLQFEELSRIVSEKASVLRHIEAGQYAPTTEIAKRLEKALGIKIIEKS